MACAQKKKAGSPKKKKTSAKVASPKGEKSKEDAIINLSQTGSPLRKFSKNLSEYKPSWEVNGGFRIAIKKLPKAFVIIKQAKKLGLDISAKERFHFKVYTY